MQKVLAKIHLGNIRRNAERFRDNLGTALCAVVKANAYGHGAEEVVNALGGVADSFAVALLDEGLQIRGVACGKEILVLTPPTTSQDVLCGAWNGFSLTVADFQTAALVDYLSRLYKIPVSVHLKINTGMNRYGMDRAILGKVCKRLHANPWVKVFGAYSHLYGARVETAEKQRVRFIESLTVCKRYFPNVKAHLSATYGALLGKRYAFDGIRVGLGLYGYLPESATADGFPALEKGMTIFAKATSSRKYRYGGVGYGESSLREIPKDLTVCRYGYADGFLRLRKNGLLGAEKQLNHLCMDACIREGILSRGGYIPIMTDAQAVAKATGTIPYEVLCAATRRAEMTYDNE